MSLQLPSFRKNDPPPSRLVISSFFCLHPFQQREVLTAEKETAVKYKGKDKKETEAFLSETKDDLGTTQEELDAVTAKMTFCGDRDTFQSICANTVER